MSRSKIISDAQVFSETCRLLAEGGDKAASFAAVARRSGLAAPTLVQRYQTREAMVRLALMAAWDELDAETAHAEAGAAMTPKGAAQLLKALTGDLSEGAGLLAAGFRDAALRARAEAWRARVEAALAQRLGEAEAAALMFAAWQGQVIWQSAGGKGFRLRDAVKRLT